MSRGPCYTGDLKGVVVKDTGNNFNWTYYGGRTEKSREYKDRFCKGQKTNREDYDMYEKNTWYQAHLNSKEHSDLPAGAVGDFRDANTCWQKVTQREASVCHFETTGAGATGNGGATLDKTNKTVNTITFADSTTPSGSDDRDHDDDYNGHPAFEDTRGSSDMNTDTATSFDPIFSTNQAPDQRAFGRSKPIRPKHR
jgi:hypothetical protein